MRITELLTKESISLGVKLDSKDAVYWLSQHVRSLSHF